MLRKRVIPCLDVRGGRLVKGINFESLRDCGDPVDAARRYAADGADEIVWLNIAAGEESWTALLRAVERAAETVDVPLCVGGGVSGTDDGRELLLAGADKISVNTAPLDRPALIAELADRFGSQCVVVRSTPPAATAAGRPTPAAAAAPPAATRWPGHGRRPSWARASCW